MGEVCRVYNRHSPTITVAVEPWGSQYEVPEFNYLSVWIDESFGLIEIALGSEKEINVYLNDCTFDDLSTSVVHFQSG